MSAEVPNSLYFLSFLLSAFSCHLIPMPSSLRQLGGAWELVTMKGDGSARG